jgi:hypothetical protein
VSRAAFNDTDAFAIHRAAIDHHTVSLASRNKLLIDSCWTDDFNLVCWITIAISRRKRFFDRLLPHHRGAYRLSPQGKHSRNSRLDNRKPSFNITPIRSGNKASERSADRQPNPYRDVSAIDLSKDDIELARDAMKSGTNSSSVISGSA